MGQEYIYVDKKENDAKNTAIIIGLLTIFIVSIIGATYAFFTANMTGRETGTTITVTGGTLNIHMDGGNIINLSNIFPRDEAWETKRFTVTGNNNTSLDMPYYLSGDGSLTTPFVVQTD